MHKERNILASSLLVPYSISTSKPRNQVLNPTCNVLADLFLFVIFQLFPAF